MKTLKILKALSIIIAFAACEKEAGQKEDNIFFRDEYMSFTKENFYYAFNEKIPIVAVENKIVVRYASDRFQKFELLNLPDNINSSQVNWLDDSTAVITAINDPIISEILKNNSILDEIASLQPVYSFKNTYTELYITDEILVKFLESVTEDEIKEIHSRYDVRVANAYEGKQKLKVSPLSDALELSQFYQESELVLYAQPNFITEITFFTAYELHTNTN